MKGESKEKKIRKVRDLREEERKRGNGEREILCRQGLTMYLRRQVLLL